MLTIAATMWMSSAWADEAAAETCLRTKIWEG